MSRKPHALTNDPRNDILKALERVQATSHRRRYEVFDDWLRLVEASLDALPRHVANVTTSKQLAEDTPETQALFARMRSIYSRPDQWENFALAFAALLELPDLFWSKSLPAGGPDVLGSIYMDLSYKPGSGQFFTPWEVASMMAQMTMGGFYDTEDGKIGQEVMERLNAAGRAVLADPADPNNPMLTAVTLAGLMLDRDEFTDEDRQRWIFEKVLPLVIHRYEPITVMDCCCGSGIMLLAGAYHAPAWIVQSGLIQFYGADIDETCVRMARCNVMLYGLNGSYVQSAAALSEGVLASLPAPYADAYQYAKELAAVAPEVVPELADELRQAQSLFDLDAFVQARPSVPRPNGKTPAVTEQPAPQLALLEV